MTLSVVDCTITNNSSIICKRMVVIALTSVFHALFFFFFEVQFDTITSIVVIIHVRQYEVPMRSEIYSLHKIMSIAF